MRGRGPGTLVLFHIRVVLLKLLQVHVMHLVTCLVTAALPTLLKDSGCILIGSSRVGPGGSMAQLEIVHNVSV